MGAWPPPLEPRLTTLPDPAPAQTPPDTAAIHTGPLLPPLGATPVRRVPARWVGVVAGPVLSGSASKVSARFMLSHPAHLIALGFGAGLSRLAPGTVATVWAWAAFLLLSNWLTDALWAWVCVVGFFVGWWASTVTARNLQLDDPGAIVIDEILAFWLVLWVLMPVGFAAQVAAFVLFRIFDAAKPGPVGWADKALKGPGAWGGLGVMLDDYVAAACTLLVMAVWRFLA